MKKTIEVNNEIKHSKISFADVLSKEMNSTRLLDLKDTHNAFCEKQLM